MTRAHDCKTASMQARTAGALAAPKTDSTRSGVSPCDTPRLFQMIPDSKRRCSSGSQQLCAAYDTELDRSRFLQMGRCFDMFASEIWTMPATNFLKGDTRKKNRSRLEGIERWGGRE